MARTMQEQHESILASLASMHEGFCKTLLGYKAAFDALDTFCVDHEARLGAGYGMAFLNLDVSELYKAVSNHHRVDGSVFGAQIAAEELVRRKSDAKAEEYQERIGRYKARLSDKELPIQEANYAARAMLHRHDAAFSTLALRLDAEYVIALSKHLWVPDWTQEHHTVFTDVWKLYCDASAEAEEDALLYLGYALIFTDADTPHLTAAWRATTAVGNHVAERAAAHELARRD
ncbi:MAG: hypothetical protein LBQ02_00560 [Candidatus Nomurabacteria bacterium]|nr:hypothetical protein [Candidatus Nomurabacteria bacterium]